MKLITLDFEGTLVNFQWKLVEAVMEVQETLAKIGLSSEMFQGMNYAKIYNSVREIEKEGRWGFTNNQLIHLVDEIYDKYDLDAASRWEPVDELLDTLQHLQQNCRLALVSNIGQQGLKSVLNNFGLQATFDLMVTRNDVTLLKPHPEGLLMVMNQFGVSPEDVIHIGDSLADLFAARSAGIKVGIVLGGENTPEVLQREQPELLVNKFSDLPAALNELYFR